MKMFQYLTLILMLGVILSACASSAPKPSDEMINPGDRIGDFLIIQEKATMLSISQTSIAHSMAQGRLVSSL